MGLRVHAFMQDAQDHNIGLGIVRQTEVEDDMGRRSNTFAGQLDMPRPMPLGNFRARFRSRAKRKFGDVPHRAVNKLLIPAELGNTES